MRTGILIVLLSSLGTFSQAQEWQFGVGYRYHYAPEWDKAIQTYNFSRPFLEEKQPLLVSGTYLEASYRFKTNNNLGSGIQLAHSFVRSRSDSPNLETALNWHSLQLNYVLRYQPSKLALDLEIGAIGGLLSRKVNGEVFEVDSEKKRAMGGSAQLGVTASYDIALTERSSLLPFVGLGYTPYYFAPETESILNQSQELTGEDYSALLTWKVGVRWRLMKSFAEAE